MPVPNSPFLMLPTGTGDRKEIRLAGISPEQAAAWLPDGRSILFAGSEPGRGLRLWVQGVDGGKPRPITPEGITAALPGFAISPDSKLVAAIGPERKAMLFPLAGAPPRPIPGLDAGDDRLRVPPDGRPLYGWTLGDVLVRCFRVVVG